MALLGPVRNSADSPTVIPTRALIHGSDSLLRTSARSPSTPVMMALSATGRSAVARGVAGVVVGPVVAAVAGPALAASPSAKYHHASVAAMLSSSGRVMSTPAAGASGTAGIRSST